MGFRCLSVLLLVTLAAGQAKTPPQAGAQPPSAEIAPNTPVITVVGVCSTSPPPKTATTEAKSASCQTVITKAEFESLANALQPNMNPATKRMLAERYPKMLVLANAARKRGLENDPDFKKVVQFYRMQILTQELAKSVKEKSEKVPESEIEKYYKDNAAEFEQATLQRIYVPKDKQVEPAAGEKAQAKPADLQKADEEALKKKADELRTRAAAGEDPEKLQKEAYDAAGLKGTPPQTSIGKLSRSELPPPHRSVIDLKPGEVSQVIAEPNGFYIYKLISKEVKPLDAAKSDISNKIAQQKFQDEMQAIENSAEIHENEAYFGAPPAAPSMPGGMAPGAHPAAGGRPPAPPQVSAPAAAPNTPPAPPTVNQSQNPENPKK